MIKKAIFLLILPTFLNADIFEYFPLDSLVRNYCQMHREDHDVQAIVSFLNNPSAILKWVEMKMAILKRKIELIDKANKLDAHSRWIDTSVESNLFDDLVRIKKALSNNNFSEESASVDINEIESIFNKIIKITGFRKQEKMNLHIACRNIAHNERTWETFNKKEKMQHLRKLGFLKSIQLGFAGLGMIIMGAPHK